MKTMEEFSAQKEEVETLNKKLAELTQELQQVAGGAPCDDPCPLMVIWLLRKNSFSENEKKIFVYSKYDVCCNLRGKVPSCNNCDFYSTWQTIINGK